MSEVVEKLYLINGGYLEQGTIVYFDSYVKYNLDSDETMDYVIPWTNIKRIDLKKPLKKLRDIKK